MKPQTTTDVRNLLRMYIASAALGAALELGLFWRLAERPLGVKEVSQKFNIPFDRCQRWLEVLAGLELLEQRGKTFSPSSITYSTILETYSQESWAFIAQEARVRYPAGTNLTLHISHPASVWVAQGLEPPNWFTQIINSPKYAERFIRTLYDLHQPFAEKLAQTLDMTAVKHLMDLGGGSGVVSLALLNHYSDLTAVVVDIENVCSIGREIANESHMVDRIIYYAADFLRDNLPTGFDMVLMCDVGPYTEELFSKLRGTLNEGGRLVIITNIDECSGWLAHSESKPSLPRLINVFLSSLAVSRVKTTTVGDVKNLLTKARFHNVSEQIWDDGTVIVQAHNLD
ncbi:MAG: methyltransferase [Candidatus Hodarchaeota archaeon]